MTKWLKNWFNQTSSLNGLPTRRSKKDVHRHCQNNGYEMLIEAKKRNWHIIATDTHYILIPTGRIKILC